MGVITWPMLFADADVGSASMDFAMLCLGGGVKIFRGLALIDFKHLIKMDKGDKRDAHHRLSGGPPFKDYVV
jgi:hypothetical protein